MLTVTVVVAVYNIEKYIEKCIQSIIRDRKSTRLNSSHRG